MAWYAKRPSKPGVLSDVYDGSNWQQVFSNDPIIQEASQQHGTVS
jgi:hypothetical protein